MHQPRKRFGQHFLHDEHILDEIIKTISPRPSDHIVEIGPGQGALTDRLSPLAKQLSIIEIDRDLIKVLQEKFTHTHLAIYNQDVLKFNFEQLTDQPHSLRIVGNLPYNISTPLLFHLFSFLNIIQDMTFMLQKEVVDRLCATVGSKQYGRLSVMAQYYCHTEYLFTVDAAAFTPPPKVASAIIVLCPHTTLQTLKNPQHFSTIVREAFNHRRKTIHNALKDYVSANEWQQLNIDPNLRPQNLTVQDFVNISNIRKSP